MNKMKRQALKEECFTNTFMAFVLTFASIAFISIFAPSKETLVWGYIIGLLYGASTMYFVLAAAKNWMEL